MNFGIFRNLLALFFLAIYASFGQVPDNEVVIELSQTTFSIERPFTISVIIPNSESRATVTFPDITGFSKKGISTSLSPIEIGGKTTSSQVITQTYRALAPGRYIVSPFTLVVNGESVHSVGATLQVQSGVAAVADETILNSINITPNNAAFLSIRASKSSIYAGEGVALTLSFFVADNYPYILNFTSANKQLQTIIKKLRPVNAWEESEPINELKPVPVLIRGRKFREIRLYKSIFFPLSNQDLRLPAVSLQLTRPQPKIGPPEAQAETVTFTSQPLTIDVKPLPTHPLRGRVPVGVFRLEEGLERRTVNIDQSVRYVFTIAGEGNIATLPAPILRNESTELNIFPPEERHVVTRAGNQITGYKTFSYFMVAHQNGEVPLANCFQWIYFDPQTARYDTLHPRIRLQVGRESERSNAQAVTPGSISAGGGEAEPTLSADKSLYAGIEALDSNDQPVNVSVLVRAIANVLIAIMLLGMVFVLIKKQNVER